MSDRALFSFHNDNVLQIRIQDGINLRVDRLNMAVACVHFVDDEYAEVPIPKGFKILDNSNRNIPVHPPFGNPRFFLGWGDNYSLFLNNTLLAKLHNQRQWAVQGSLECVIEKVEALIDIIHLHLYICVVPII